MDWSRILERLTPRRKSEEGPEPAGLSRFPVLDEMVTTARTGGFAPVDGPPPKPREDGPLDLVRFLPEATLIDELFERFGLDEVLDGFEEHGKAANGYEALIAGTVRVTPILAPRLTGLFGEVRKQLDFHEDVQLFLAGEPMINAAAIHSPGEGVPHAVMLTSPAVERMTDDELRFVLGHEIGHLAYRHYRALLVDQALRDSDGDSVMPPLLVARMSSWNRLCELSADRAGMLASSGELQTMVSAFFKIETGLGPEHLRFDLQAFLDQLAELREIGRKELLARYSHPATPVRARALQLFAGRWGDDWAERRESLDEEVLRIAHVMEYEVTEPDEVHARDFILAGGLLVAHADGQEVGQDQWELLVDQLLPYVPDPEGALAGFESFEELEQLFGETAEWLREHAGSERFGLFNVLCHLAAVDGEIHPGEREFLYGAADLMAIPRKAASEALYDVLRAYMGARGTRNRPMAGRRLR